jgi:tRNA(fMet)-specific endonuclease VapC
MFCLDTNVVIFAINLRRPRVAVRLDAELAAGTRLIVPAIVRFELEYGCARSVKRDQSRAALDGFLSASFEQPPFDIDDAREAGEIRAELEAKGTPIGAYDTLIAAQARRRGATLVTANMREFSRVPGLLVADWAA